MATVSFLTSLVQSQQESSKSITDSDTGGPTTVVASCNFPATSDPMKYKEPLQVVIHVLNRHPLSSTLFYRPPSVPMSLLVATIDSAIKHNYSLTVTLANGVEIIFQQLCSSHRIAKFNPIFGKVSRLLKGFLKYGDHEDELVKQHMVITENIEDYP
ncbi:hypothetical protein L2E82_31147 [Cichorium intybus]|uniref:Uncharacterized protein n=1 Tax=Cichorium intybus TaxID=13427 RepID=A0ACB9D246_CICIN|nr:hypothetical protein L2E82_31147 [Cichorium intybus]